MKQIFEVPVLWTMSGYAKVEAETFDEACKYVQAQLNDRLEYSLNIDLDNGEFVEESIELGEIED